MSYVNVIHFIGNVFTKKKENHLRYLRKPSEISLYFFSPIDIVHNAHQSNNANNTVTITNLSICIYVLDGPPRKHPSHSSGDQE